MAVRKSWDALLVLGLASLGLALAACGTEKDPAGGLLQGAAGQCAPGMSYTCACPGGVNGSQLCALDGLSLGACTCGSAAGTGAAGTAAPAGNALPCDVKAIVDDHCGLCHGAQTAFTAPMSLVTWDDLMAPTPSNPAVPTYQTVLQRVQDEARPMPQPPNARLTTDQVATLNNWINGGTPKGTDTMCGSGGTAGTGTAGSGAGVGAAGTGTAGTGAAGTGVPTEEVCYDFLANAGGDKTTPYSVPTTPDLYHCFYFAPPWGTDKVHAIRSETVIDNSAVLHHWILYSNASAVQDGTHGNCSGSHAGGQFLVGWAPGAPDMQMPDDVGLEMPGAGYALEIHYNAKTAGQQDASGVRLCVTRELKAQTAATHPLGKEAFSKAGAGDVVGTCKPRGPFPITILTSSPHMHLKGTHMKTIINRANGTKETLVDEPFDFNNQLVYDTPTQIFEGDTLTTTCTYNASASFGQGTNEEMCYNFVTAYPAGALEGASGYTGVSGNGNTCINVF
jgi:hypothetical protein